MTDTPNGPLTPGAEPGPNPPLPAAAGISPARVGRALAFVSLGVLALMVILRPG